MNMITIAFNIPEASVTLKNGNTTLIQTERTISNTCQKDFDRVLAQIQTHIPAHQFTELLDDLDTLHVHADRRADRKIAGHYIEMLLSIAGSALTQLS